MSAVSDTGRPADLEPDRWHKHFSSARHAPHRALAGMFATDFGSDLGLLRDFQRIVDLDAEISDRRFQLRVTECNGDSTFVGTKFTITVPIDRPEARALAMVNLEKLH
jgi:hypothetical protein